MKTVLTFVFVIVSCLLFGGLVGHEIGYSGRAKLVVQRDKSLKLAEEYEGLLRTAEGAALKCLGELRTLHTLAIGCCEAAEKALNDLDSCKGKADGKKR